MNIQQLDDECLKAVLIRLPIKDFFKNAKPVSRRFRDATEFSLKHLVARHELLSIDIFGGSRASNGKYGLPHVTLADMRISSKAFSNLNQCSLLPFVPKLSLHNVDALFCEDEASMDFVLHLRAILLKMLCVTHLQLPLKATGHCDDRADTDKASRLKSSNTFRSIAFNAAGLLSQLHKLEIANPGSHNQFQFQPNSPSDFAVFITFAKQLTRLIVPLPLFAYAAKADKTVLQQLNSLYLYAINCVAYSLSCQDAFQLICDACPELNDLRYDCALCVHPKVGCRCVSDFSVLRRLNKLRSLTLNFGEGAMNAEAQPFNLPSVEINLSLILPIGQQHKAMQMLQLSKISPNLKSLELLQNDNGSDHLPVDITIAYLKELLVSGELQRLERLLIVAPPMFGESPNIYELIHEITTIPTQNSLRKIKIKETRRFSSCDVFLPSANSCSIEESGPEIGITYAIAKAENISELCFPMDWSDSYLQLEQLVLAMQHGSLKRLIVMVDWHTHSDEDQFGIDKRAFLPAGCRVVNWILRKNHWGKAVLKSVVIVGHKLGPNGTPLCSDESAFWVYVVDAPKPKPY